MCAEARIRTNNATQTPINSNFHLHDKQMVELVPALLWQKWHSLFILHFPLKRPNGRAPAAAHRRVDGFYPKSEKLEIYVNLRLGRSAACLCWAALFYDG
jgi:hypothetical protein